MFGACNVRRLGMVVALAVAVPSVVAGTASAAGVTPTATSGSVTMTGVTPLTVKNVGGGTWNYGVTYNVSFGKHCYSDYYHPTNYHSATSIIGSTNNTNHAPPGQWADSYANGSLFGTCHAYWNNND